MTLATLQAAFGRWLREECPDAAARLGGGPGLDVYLNNYRSQLIAALEAGFPQLRRYLGETAFLAAAAHHIEASPPRAWTLDAYGGDFAQTIAALHGEDPAASDLAALEWALAQAFVADDAAPVAIEALGAVDWESARFRFVPSLMLLPIASNAGDIWQALVDAVAPPATCRTPAPAHLLLWRRGFQPQFRTAAPGEADAIALLRGGASFGDLCAGLGARHGAERGATLAGGWLGSWLREGLIADIA